MPTGKTIGQASISGNPADVALAFQLGGGIPYPGTYTIAQTAATTAFIPLMVLVQSVRVSAGDAAAATRIVSDASGTASGTVCKAQMTVVSGVPGTLLTFEDTVSAGVVAGLFIQPAPLHIVEQVGSNGITNITLAPVES